MKVALAMMAATLLSSGAALAGGGFATGFATGQQQAEMQSLCIEALRREIAGGPPAPIACQASTAAPSWTASPRRAPLRCDTTSYYRINGVPQYTTQCY